ncbi:ankyrin repeat domain-containing protein [Aquabacterium sp. A3]|uniref:ankyrin repeat domain-containing protein n=1 Tax=Aquabacterium sp. A3 TaxID=3132829 RepID=UPI00311A839D
MAFKPFDDLSCAALRAAFPAALLCLTLSGWSAPAVSQVLPPWRVDTMASRDVNDWLEFAQPALPSSSDRPVDDAEFAAVAKGGPWTPSDWAPLTGEVPALMALARQGDWAGLLQGLARTDAPVNERDRDGATLLTLAARQGQLSVVSELLRRGAQPDQQGLYGLSPLGAAALGGHELVVQALLRAGADPLRWSGAGQAPLHLAARGGHARVMRSLLAGGAELMQFNREGRHALAEAARAGQIEAMAWLLDQAQVPVNAPDLHGLTAVHAAALGRHFEAVQWLQQRGATLQHPLTPVLIERAPDPLPLN